MDSTFFGLILSGFKSGAIVIAFFLLVSVAAMAEEESIQSLENIASELVTIRQVIANLHDQISFEKSLYSDKIRAFSNQKSDLEVKINRESLNRKDLQRELVKLQELNQDKFSSHRVITPVVKQSIATLRETISQSLPFQLDERLRALRDIETRLNANIISPNKAANQLWAFIEDELILGRSSGIYTLSLNLEGEIKLVKALRIGQLALFYRTGDGQYGQLSKSGSGWSQKALTSTDDTRALDQLFDSFMKNIRNGQFTVPNFLSGL